jgi:hypothetical protein
MADFKFDIAPGVRDDGGVDCEIPLAGLKKIPSRPASQD